MNGKNSPSLSKRIKIQGFPFKLIRQSTEASSPAAPPRPRPARPAPPRPAPRPAPPRPPPRPAPPPPPIEKKPVRRVVVSKTLDHDPDSA